MTTGAAAVQPFVIRHSSFVICIDAHQLARTESRATPAPAVVDPRRRLRYCLGAFVLLLIFVWCRAVQLEISQGAAFREEALRPHRRETPLPAARGRILARDGSVLACDQPVAAVAVQYRYFEEPPRQAWLEQLARQRLPKDQRRNAARLAEEVQKLRQERDELHRRLAALCGVELAQWQARASRLQNRVERIAAEARRRQIEAARSAPPRDDATWADRFSTALHRIFEPARDALPETVTVAEELADHVLAEGIPAAAVAEIQQHAEQFPGTRILRLTRRTYPAGALAAHVLGYLGPPSAPIADQAVGNALRGVPYDRHSSSSRNATEGVPYSGDARRESRNPIWLAAPASSSNARPCCAGGPESASKSAIMPAADPGTRKTMPILPECPDRPFMKPNRSPAVM